MYISWILEQRDAVTASLANCTPSARCARVSARVTSFLLLRNQLALGTRTRGLVKKDFTMALLCLKCGHSTAWEVRQLYDLATYKVDVLMVFWDCRRIMGLLYSLVILLDKIVSVR